MHFDPEALQRAVAQIPEDDWNKPSSIEQNGAHEGYRSINVVGGRRWMTHAPLFAEVLHALEPVYKAWVSWIEPGGYIVPHIDGGPYLERWQVPISTAGTFDQSGDEFAPIDGVPFRVHQWEPHSVTNDSDKPRIHLVVDRDVEVGIPNAPFRVL